jgi:hypothetical protein
MNNWDELKFMVGEVDTYKKYPDFDLYADFNVNYVKLDRVPGFNFWSPVCRALRPGEFFATTGEVLIPGWKVEAEGKDKVVVAVWSGLLCAFRVAWLVHLSQRGALDDRNQLCGPSAE